MINPEFFLITTLVGFFAMMNPAGNLKVFMKLVEHHQKDPIKQIALKSVMYSFIIITVFTLFGNYIFEFLFISIDAFRIAGGILVIVIGFQLLHGKIAKSHAPLPIKRKNRSDNWLALTPLAIPMLSGPGTILLAINFSTLHKETLHILVILVGLALNCIFCYVLFISAEKILHKIGEDTVDVIARLMGLIIAFMGVEMLISGISEISRSLQP